MIPRIIGITGWSGSGKTTLLRAVLPLLTAEGLAVSTVKHAHHDFDIDRPGKDSWLHRQAGATEVLVASDRRWALMHEHRDEAPLPLAGLLARMSPVDLVIVEGYKRDPHPKIEVWRAVTAKPPIYLEDPTILALATDDSPPGAPPVLLPLDDAAAIARFIAAAAAPLASIDFGGAR